MEDEKKIFQKGFLIGAVLMLACTSIVLIGLKFIWENAGVSSGLRTEGKADEKTLFADSTETKMKEIKEIIDAYCYWDIEEDQLVEGMYSGILSGLKDPYSVYYTKEEYQSILDGTTGQYSGIGAVLSQKKDSMEVLIANVFEDSPAEEAGLKDGDIIVFVDEVEAVTVDLSTLVTHIKGEAGSTVHLQIMREGQENLLEVDVTRRTIETPTIEFEMLPGNIGFIQIMEFTEVTVQQFEDAKNALQNQDMKSLIIDLRGNPGGSYPVVCKILDQILPKGMIVYIEDKNGARTEQNSDAEHYVDVPIAVLIDENSASASEIFAGAIKDHQYGTLIGTKTFGKGIVQSIIPMDDGSAVKVTMAKYFTPAGTDIHEIGIEPDIEIEFEYEENKEYERMQDNQVLKAIEVLNTKSR